MGDDAMSNTPELKVSERDTTLTPSRLRSAGYVPATVYGRGHQSQNIQVRTHEFYHAFLQGEREFHFTGFVSGPAKIKNMSRHPVSQIPLAIEFCLDNGDAEGLSSKKKAKAGASAQA